MWPTTPPQLRRVNLYITESSEFLTEGSVNPAFVITTVAAWLIVAAQ